MFGEDDSWQIVADWLKGLDAEEVLQYFEGRRYSTRLGDHFAACIEYVLKFSPLLSPDPLFISQQVGGGTILNQQSLRTLKKAKGEFGNFALQKGGMMSEVIVKLIENDVLIKRFSSYQINRRGRIKEISQSDIECLMADFKGSSFDYHASKEIEGLVLSEECHEGWSEPNHTTNAVHERMLVLPELLGIGVSARGTQKWRVHYSVGSKQQDFTGNKVQKHRLPVSNTAESGSKPELKELTSRNIRPTNHVSSDTALLKILSVGKLTTEADEKVNMSQKFTNAAWRNVIKKSTPLKNLKNLQRSSKQQLEMGKGDTAGECDFLFKVNAKQLIEDSLDYAWAQVHHWEVSVHFLSYIGPWEVFGLVTPGSSVWHHCGKRVFAALEGLDPNNIDLYLGTIHQLLRTSVGDDQVLVLDACYVAPSIGDTWFDRKKSMGSKLQLCRHPNMAAKVSNLFHSSLLTFEKTCGSIEQKQVQKNESRDYKPLLGPQGQSYDKYREDPSIIRVIPRALTKGYLFYEPELWFSLCARRDRGEEPVIKQTKRGESFKSPRNFSISSLNVNHWMGWWVYACDFAQFACSYGCEGSMWYIAPRNEWLSPIIINRSEMHRCRRVFDLVGMLTMILKVGEEAAALHPPRHRRFMVVEVCWSPGISISVVSPPSCKYKGATHHHHHQCVDSSEEKGGWVEVSRGFIVEKTWPDSREQLAHGFTLSWSPALLGWS